MPRSEVGVPSPANPSEFAENQRETSGRPEEEGRRPWVAGWRSSQCGVGGGRVLAANLPQIRANLPQIRCRTLGDRKGGGGAADPPPQPALAQLSHTWPCSRSHAQSLLTSFLPFYLESRFWGGHSSTPISWPGWPGEFAANSLVETPHQLSPPPPNSRLGGRGPDPQFS